MSEKQTAIAKLIIENKSKALRLLQENNPCAGFLIFMNSELMKTHIESIISCPEKPEDLKECGVIPFRHP